MKSIKRLCKFAEKDNPCSPLPAIFDQVGIVVVASTTTLQQKNDCPAALFYQAQGSLAHYVPPPTKAHPFQFLSKPGAPQYNRPQSLNGAWPALPSCYETGSPSRQQAAAAVPDPDNFRRLPDSFDYDYDFLGPDSDDDLSVPERNTTRGAVGDDVDGTLLAKKRKFDSDNCGGRLPLEKGMVVQERLLKLLNRAKSPMSVMDEIQKWASESVREVKFDFGDQRTTLKGRKAFMQSIFNRYDMEDTKPQIVKVELPSSRELCDLSVFDARANVYSMLTSPSLMQGENLLFTDDDPFAMPPDKAKEYSDINSGSRCRDAHRSLCQPGTIEVPLPIVLFIDKTHTDVRGTLCLESVTMTLGIFRRAARNQPKA
jgi:hypothetical protein